jgi:hypothetical protein
MRTATAVLAIAGAAFLGHVERAAAQSPYDYPWCAVHGKTSGAEACYYASYGQCIATMRGIGGYCIRNPYLRVRDPRRY